MNELELYRLKDSVFVEKANGTKVNYFIFDEFEIHQNIISPRTSQEWHRHEVIEEVLVVTSGVIAIKWKDNDRTYMEKASKGMVIRVGNSLHTIENLTDEQASFLVFRMVPDGKSKRDIIKNDKVTVS